MKRVMVALSVTLGLSCVLATGKPLQISLTPEIGLYDRSVPIEGLSLNLWGENPQRGLALGLVNGSTGNSAGISVALLLNYADNYSGLQVGLVNYTGGAMLGFQAGVVNCAGALTGLQVGLINYAVVPETGLQIGLLNLMPENRWLWDLPDDPAPAMIFVNWHF